MLSHSDLTTRAWSYTTGTGTDTDLDITSGAKLRIMAVLVSTDAAAAAGGLVELYDELTVAALSATFQVNALQNDSSFISLAPNGATFSTGLSLNFRDCDRYTVWYIEEAE
jgi:hypothetical protein